MKKYRPDINGYRNEQRGVIAPFFISKNKAFATEHTELTENKSRNSAAAIISSYGIGRLID